MIAHFWLWVLILGPFSGSGKSHETPMPAKCPCHYPRAIRKTSARAGANEWMKFPKFLESEWEPKNYMVFPDVGPDFYVTPLLRQYYAREDFRKKPCWRNKFIGGGGL